MSRPRTLFELNHRRFSSLFERKIADRLPVICDAFFESLKRVVYLAGWIAGVTSLIQEDGLSRLIHSGSDSIGFGG